MEEAANIAAEYISSLDNLPNEVQFLLAEIRHKDSRCQDLMQEISKEGGRYLRHQNRGDEMTPKYAAIPPKIEDNYAEIDRLSDEKIKLCERIQTLVDRARARLDMDLEKMFTLQGQQDPRLLQNQAETTGYWANGRTNPVAQLNKSLRDAMEVPELPPASPIPSFSASQTVTKKRKLAAAPSTASIKMPSPAPPPVAVPTSRARAQQATKMQQQQLLQQQPQQQSGRSQRRRQPVFSDEESAELEEALEAEEGEEAEDSELYCFCQQPSYGEMVACDSDTCPIQWFHLNCVGLKAPLPEVWYCHVCVKNGTDRGISERPRKGRKGR